LKNLVTPFRVGLLVLTSAVFLFIFLTFVKKGGLTEREAIDVYAYFNDASGLGKKSRVQIAGIAVGEVKLIELEGTRAKVWLRIKREVDLRKDAALTKRSESLLGDYLLDLFPGTKTAEPMEERGQIARVYDQQGVEAIFESLNKITGDIQEVTGSLRRALGGEKGADSLEAIVKNLKELSAGVDQTVRDSGEKLSAILSDFQAFSDELRRISEGQEGTVRSIVVNVEGITQDVREVLDSVKKVVGAGEGDLKEGVASIKQAIARLESSLRNLEEITTRVNQGEGVAGALLTDERLGQKISETVEDVSNFASRLTRLQTEVGVQSDYLFNQGSAKNYLSLRLIPRPDKYYLLEIVDDPRGTVEKQVVQANPPESGVPVIQVQRITREGLKFSAQFAKRYYFTTVRFGIIESTGGIGGDLHLFDDHLTLKVDAFNFSVEELAYPRLRASLRLQALGHLFATVGVDDVLNPPVREALTNRLTSGFDYYVGAGIFFTDEDLKAVLTAVPLPSP
jgi:phospholipid/cholesterol/gamma-HCH transport system substrate-binding protein